RAGLSSHRDAGDPVGARGVAEAAQCGLDALAADRAGHHHVGRADPVEDVDRAGFERFALDGERHARARAAQFSRGGDRPAVAVLSTETKLHDHALAHAGSMHRRRPFEHRSIAVRRTSCGRAQICVTRATRPVSVPVMIAALFLALLAHDGCSPRWMPAEVGALYEKYGPAVYRRWFTLLRDREAAPGATPEALGKLLRGRRRRAGGGARPPSSC